MGEHWREYPENPRAKWIEPGRACAACGRKRLYALSGGAGHQGLFHAVGCADRQRIKL